MKYFKFTEEEKMLFIFQPFSTINHAYFELVFVYFFTQPLSKNWRDGNGDDSKSKQNISHLNFDQQN